MSRDIRGEVTAIVSKGHRSKVAVTIEVPAHEAEYFDLGTDVTVNVKEN